MAIPRWLDNVFAKMGYSKGITILDAPPASSSSIKGPKIFKALLMKFKSDLQSRNAKLEDQEYDFPTIRRAIDVESILRQARDKYVQLMWKYGFSFVGKDPDAVLYVKTRLDQMAIMTSTPLSAFLDSVAEELVTYHNCFIVTQRDATATSGRPYTNLFGKSVAPIAGLFLIPASNVQPFVDDKTKKLLGWKVANFKNEDDKFFSADQVVHIYMSKAVGNRMGTPMMIPVIDDIRALRKMEENAEALVYQHAIPLLEYKVGDKDNPTEDDSEITEVKAQIESSSPHGMFVVPSNHSIKAVGNGDSPINVESYLRYFRQRIISGLGLSGVVFGEGDSSNRATAIVQDKGLQDGAKKYLSVIKTFFDEFIIKELLIEGGYDLMDPIQQVHLFTPEIDIDAKIALETHHMALYHGNVISENELRTMLGKDAVDDTERGYMYWNLVGLPKALILSGDEQYSGQGEHPGLKLPGGTSIKVRPVNQQGAKTSSKPAANDKQDQFIHGVSLSIYQNLSTSLDSIMGKVMEDLPKVLEKVTYKDVMRNHVAKMSNLCENTLKSAYLEGWNHENGGNLDLDLQPLTLLSSKMAEMLRILGTDATIMLEELQEKKLLPKDTDGGGNSIRPADIINVFDTLRPRLVAMSRMLSMKAYNLGRAARIIKSSQLTLVDGGSQCLHPGEITDAVVDISVIPPHGPGCKCTIEKKERNDELSH